MIDRESEKGGVSLKLLNFLKFLVILLFAYSLVCGINLFSIQYAGLELDGVFLGGLDGDAVYLTLMNLVIAIFTLAVTAFIFLATALMERRERFEQETIRMMLKQCTHRLLALTVVSTICIIGCLIVERTENCPVMLKRGISLVAIIDIIWLLNYSFFIINYEKQLSKYARRGRKKIEKWAKKIIKKQTEQQAKQQVQQQTQQQVQQQPQQDALPIYQMLGDLSMVVDRLIENHAKEFHHTEESHVLLAITEKHPDFAEIYFKLVSYRNHLRIEGRYSTETIECSSPIFKLIQKLQDILNKELMKGESLTNMSFIGKGFFATDGRLDLSDTVLSDALFKEVDFINAQMIRTDMSSTRLYGVTIVNTVCDEAVFSETVWNGVEILGTSSFDRVVFRDADFNGQSFSGKDDVSGIMLLKLTNTSLVHANMLGCELSCVDLSYSNLKNALLSGARCNVFALSYADLGGAILTGVSMGYNSKNSDAFSISQYLRENQRKENTPLPGFELFSNDGTPLCPAFYVNLENATLTEACISQVNWNGSRIANCNLTYAVIKQCKFDNCYGKNVTFRDAIINDCSFRYAMLNFADFSYTQISECDFTDANLQNCLFVHMSLSDELGNVYNCNFVRTVFSGSQFQGCRFYKCNFKDASFDNATFINVEFVDCIFSKNTNFSNTYQMKVRGLPLKKQRINKQNKTGKRRCTIDVLRNKG